MRGRSGAHGAAPLGPASATRLGPELTWAGKRAGPVPGPAPDLDLVERIPSAGAQADEADLLVHGDNLPVMRALLPQLEGRIDLVYLDPPFATGQDFELLQGHARRGAVAYRDRWEHGLHSYLSAMADRLVLVRRLLSDRGTLFLHCDWRTSHWMRCLLDEIFGAASFKNEIVWRYRRWPAKTRVFQRMHDVLFWYGKHPGDRHAFRTLYEPLADSTRKTWGTKKQVADFSTGRRKPSQLEVETPGAPMSDVWDVGIIAPIAYERLGYPTQKPEALLERVIQAASEPGDLVADFFAGSGTTLAVAARLGRRFVGCDLGAIAIHTARKRLLSLQRTRELRLLECPDRDDGGGDDLRGLSARTETEGAMRTVRLVGPRKALSAVDAWAIDWSSAGADFVTSWSAQRTRSKSELSLESPPFPLSATSSAVRVVVYDTLGRRALLPV